MRLGTYRYDFGCTARRPHFSRGPLRWTLCTGRRGRRIFYVEWSKRP